MPTKKAYRLFEGYDEATKEGKFIYRRDNEILLKKKEPFLLNFKYILLEHLHLLTYLVSSIEIVSILLPYRRFNDST
jgi:hypothetical protein